MHRLSLHFLSISFDLIISSTSLIIKLKGHSLQNSGDSIAFIIKIPEKKKPKHIDSTQKIKVIILKNFIFFLFNFFLNIYINDIIGTTKLMV